MNGITIIIITDYKNKELCSPTLVVDNSLGQISFNWPGAQVCSLSFPLWLLPQPHQHHNDYGRPY